ncbi:MAG: hypothetical protein JWP27_2020 [Flaviaesturariibacter sp.]|nr:hypothetical protein [Flaviaesturariibacter sp.]
MRGRNLFTKRTVQLVSSLPDQREMKLPCVETAQEAMNDQFFGWCRNGDLAAIKENRRHNSDIDQRTPEGWTGLVLACFHEHPDVAAYLVAEGADVNATNAKGTTVFMYAKTPVIASGDPALLDFLLEKGADINAKDKFGKTALDYVREKEVDWLVAWLESRGAV